MRIPNDIRRKAHLVIKPFVIVNVHYTCTRATPTSLMSPRPQLESPRPQLESHHPAQWGWV